MTDDQKLTARAIRPRRFNPPWRVEQMDEARRIATNIAMLPILLGRQWPRGPLSQHPRWT
jgi:hypothetical protein